MIIEKIRDTFPKLRKSEKKVAQYILENPKKMENISLEEAAKIIGVSQPTILRMLKAIGYNGFRDAKIALVEERMKQEIAKADGNSDILRITIDEADKIEDIPSKVIRNTIRLLEDSLQVISAKSLKKAVEAIEGAEKVCIFSVENSNSIANDLLTKLIYLGIQCEFNEDHYLQSLCAGHLKKGDVAVGISYTGTSKNTVDVLEKAKKSGATTIAITNFTNTPLVKYADIVILTSNRQLLYGRDIFSRTIHLAVVDMIYMGLLLNNYEKYTKEIHRSNKLISDKRYNDLEDM